MQTNNAILELVSQSVQSRWDKYIQELEHCKVEFSEEAVHDLRVATRRLLALVDFLSLLYPHLQNQKLMTILKDQLDSYDDLRDTQVMLLEINQRVTEFPPLANFQKYLTKREKSLLEAAKKNVKAYKLNNVEKRINAIQKMVQKSPEETASTDRIILILDDVYASVLKRFKRIDPNLPPTIHRVRVRFKKFRYMVEFVYPLLPNFPEDNLQSMHDYQTKMGNIQDVEVLLSALNTFAGKKNGRNLSQAIEYYQVQHAKTIETYLENKDELYQYWRLSKTKPFPWQEETITQPSPSQRSRRKAKVPASQPSGAEVSEETITVAAET